MVEQRIFTVVQFHKEGMHHYPAASGDIEFLRHPHRHVFHMKVIIEQFHDDRDVEFIGFKRWLESSWPRELGTMSCEQIAKYYLNLLDEKYSDRQAQVEVFEDGENGGIVTRIM